MGNDMPDEAAIIEALRASSDHFYAARMLNTESLQLMADEHGYMSSESIDYFVSLINERNPLILNIHLSQEFGEEHIRVAHAESLKNRNYQQINFIFNRSRRKVFEHGVLRNNNHWAAASILCSGEVLFIDSLYDDVPEDLPQVLGAYYRVKTGKPIPKINNLSLGPNSPAQRGESNLCGFIAVMVLTMLEVPTIIEKMKYKGEVIDTDNLDELMMFPSSFNMYLRHVFQMAYSVNDISVNFFISSEGKEVIKQKMGEVSKACNTSQNDNVVSMLSCDPLTNKSFSCSTLIDENRSRRCERLLSFVGDVDVKVNSRFEDNLINSDGYEWVRKRRRVPSRKGKSSKRETYYECRKCNNATKIYVGRGQLKDVHNGQLVVRYLSSHTYPCTFEEMASIDEHCRTDTEGISCCVRYNIHPHMFLGALNGFDQADNASLGSFNTSHCMPPTDEHCRTNAEGNSCGVKHDVHHMFLGALNGFDQADDASHSSFNTSDVLLNGNMPKAATAEYNEDHLNENPGIVGILAEEANSTSSVEKPSPQVSKASDVGSQSDVQPTEREGTKEHVIFKVRNKSIHLSFYELTEDVDKFCVLDSAAVLIVSDLRKSFDSHKWGKCFGGVKMNKGISTMKCQENSSCTFVKKKWECVGQCPGSRFCCQYFKEKKQSVSVYLGKHSHSIDKSLITLDLASNQSRNRIKVNAPSNQNPKRVHFDNVGENSIRRKSVITRNEMCSIYSSYSKEGKLFKNCTDQHSTLQFTLGSEIQVNDTSAASDVVSRDIDTEDGICKYLYS